MPTPNQTALSESAKTSREQALGTIKDYKEMGVKSFGIIRGRIWCSEANTLEHLVRDPNSVGVLEEHYRASGGGAKP